MEEGDKENEVKRVNDRSPSPGVKSTAVVKYASVQCPVGYARLQCNTDLNLPPSDWGTAIDYYGLKQILTRGTGLSSFRMAHMFPDSVGEADVISGAECIKKLLKLPYQPNGTVSMIVHRVENTLLLDDFDIYDYLMKSEWSWLKDFFYENIMKTMTEQEKMQLSIEHKPSAALQLTSKFLLHSVASLPKPTEIAEVPPVTVPACWTGLTTHKDSDPQRQESTPDHLYSRTVLWTFEDIQMLIGSDLPIFGGGERPCVSLRLRDAREPINVLTGIDYWLDNLMCNVPEVLMCYHLDGIVQKYEPMKTEDLPNIENSKFSPKVIRNVAQNILSFLKSNATKAGHTYWLFKGPHDDVVKLYDLTSLCPESVDNPFTTPVAMLLYRVARNMRLTNRTRHVKELLQKALGLLNAERHPHICASAHYMLADLYLPATTDPAQPSFQEESNTESDGEDEAFADDDGKPEGHLVLRDIGNRVRHVPEPKLKPDKDAKGVGTDVPSRCGKALQHALDGLAALRHVTIDKCKEEERERLKEQILAEEQHPKMANPSEPIRMQYEPLKQTQPQTTEPKNHNSRSRRRRRERKNTDKEIIESTIDKNAIQILKETNTFPSLNEPNRSDNFAWKLHLKTLLYEKICLAYATLAEFSYTKEQYGFSIKYIDIASKCQRLLSNMIIKSRVVDNSCLLGRLGDNYFQLSKRWNCLDAFWTQFQKDHNLDSKVRLEIDNDMTDEVEKIECDDYDLEVIWPTSEVDAMVRSCALYRRAANRLKTRELQRRLASVTNELGLKYMHEAQNIYEKYVQTIDDSDPGKGKLLLKQFNKLSGRARDCLTEATEIFEQVDDIENLALLYCNQARYMRFKAHCDRGPFNFEKRALYSRAAELYTLAVCLTGAHAPGTGVAGLAYWELSCLHYTRATLMLDEPHNYPAEPNEVAEALKVALKHCHLSVGPRQYLYQYRAAMIHHRLASLYHAQYRLSLEDGPRRRTVLAQACLHYDNATQLFSTTQDAPLYLVAALEHVSLMETQANYAPNLKLKSYQTALQLLRQCQSIMKLIEEREQETDSKDSNSDATDNKKEFNLLELFENRLNFIIKSVIQYCRTKSNKDYEKLTETYKKFYSVSLKIHKNEKDIRAYARSICTVLKAMEEIKELEEE